MTKKHSELGDNNGLCERCNREETRHQMQQAMPVYLGGGLGWGTMWCCAQCIAESKKKKELLDKLSEFSVKDLQSLVEKAFSTKQ